MKRGRLGRWAILACAGLLAAAPARAQPPELLGPFAFPALRNLTSVRADGMGGAVRGFSTGNEALLVNPAAIAGAVRFNLTGSIWLGPTHGFRVIGIDAVDSALNAEQSLPVSGGFGYYNYASGEGPLRRTGSMTALAFALPLAPETVFIGTTLKYLALSGAVRSSAVTADAAIQVRPSPYFSLAGIGYNLIDIRNPEARRSWAVGAAIGPGDRFHIALDATFDPDPIGDFKTSAAVGAEYLFGGFLMPRLGFAYDALREVRELTGGLSVVVSTLALEVAYRHMLNTPGWQLSFALRLLSAPF